MLERTRNLLIKESSNEKIRPRSVLRNRYNKNIFTSFSYIDSSSAKNTKKIYKINKHPHKIDKEQLYSENIQLKQYINKLEKELLIYKIRLKQKEKELKQKEKIIDKYINNNSNEVDKVDIKEKLIESNLISAYKDQYFNLRTQYENVININEEMKKNIKETKFKEYLTENLTLKKQISKMKKLFQNNKKKNKIFNTRNKELNLLKQKFLEQHILINTFMKNTEILNTEIDNLKKEKSDANNELLNTKRKSEKLQLSLDKLKSQNNKFLKSKKNLEEIKLNNYDTEKTIRSLKSELNSIKFAYDLKNNNYNELLKSFNDYKKINETQKKADNVKPFNYELVKNIEKENLPGNYTEIELYKSLYKESKLKNFIYEKYLIEKNLSPNQIIKNYGFDGVLSSENK